VKVCEKNWSLESSTKLPVKYRLSCLGADKIIYTSKLKISSYGKFAVNLISTMFIVYKQWKYL
jgi:hypothetical protein